MTTDHDLEAIRKRHTKTEEDIQNNYGAAYSTRITQDSYSIHKDRAALLAMLSTRAVTQPTREQIARAIYDVDRITTARSTGVAVVDEWPDTSAHGEYIEYADAILALPGLSLPQTQPTKEQLANEIVGLVFGADMSGLWAIGDDEATAIVNRMFARFSLPQGSANDWCFDMKAAPFQERLWLAVGDQTYPGSRHKGLDFYDKPWEHWSYGAGNGPLDPTIEPRAWKLYSSPPAPPTEGSAG